MWRRAIHHSMAGASEKARRAELPGWLSGAVSVWKLDGVIIPRTGLGNAWRIATPVLEDIMLDHMKARQKLADLADEISMHAQNELALLESLPKIKPERDAMVVRVKNLERWAAIIRESLES